MPASATIIATPAIAAIPISIVIVMPAVWPSKITGPLHGKCVNLCHGKPN